MPRIVVLLSVDWEPDHGKWEGPRGEITYRGILEATPILQQILDRANVPFTWFLETSHEVDRNTPTLFPDIVRGICRRPTDEVGLHIHWRRSTNGESSIYETTDERWVQDQIAFGVRQLSRFAIVPRAFRSGALLRIENLPKLLADNAFTVDSSTLWNHSNALTQDGSALAKRPFARRIMDLVKRLSEPLPQPYCPDWFDVEQAGHSPIVEFPIAGHALDLAYPIDGFKKRVLIRKAGRGSDTQFLTLFFHIDELMNVSTKRNDQGRDSLVTTRFAEFLERLKKRRDVSFATFSDARLIYQEQSSRRAITWV